MIAEARAGSDEAFEALFCRYRDRLTGYVRGFVRDDGRAEDLVQETFVSALRSVRQNERDIAFKPWIYQIARNACIDYLRRQKTRAGEVSLDADDLRPHDEGRLVSRSLSAEATLSQRETLDTLRQAFGGLPPTQHEALVLRELEGLSYAEIGRRLSLTPAAVESTLFRARRGLRDEYEEITTGERCRRMQGVIAALGEGMDAPRDRRMLVRHVRHCAGCRSDALLMGLRDVVDGRDGSRFHSALRGAAALLPFPFLGRRTGAGDSLLERLFGRAQSAVSSAGGVTSAPVAEQAGALAKTVAVVAAAAVIGGGGLVAQDSARGGAAAPASHSPAGASGADGAVFAASGNGGDFSRFGTRLAGSGTFGSFGAFSGTGSAQASPGGGQREFAGSGTQGGSTAPGGAAPISGGGERFDSSLPSLDDGDDSVWVDPPLTDVGPSPADDGVAPTTVPDLPAQPDPPALPEAPLPLPEVPPTEVPPAPSLESVEGAAIPVGPTGP